MPIKEICMDGPGGTRSVIGSVIGFKMIEGLVQPARREKAIRDDEGGHASHDICKSSPG